MFVFFGGDTQDAGIGDIRLTRLVLSLKQEHADRVQLIIGNRDAILRHTTPDAVSEEDVVESYRNEVDPKSEADKSPTHDNFMLNYLQQGKLAYVFGSTLFVHGGISESNIGTVPGKRERVKDVREWVRELNSWAAQELTTNFAADPYSGSNLRDRKGGGLMDYRVPGGNGGASVIYEHFLSNGNATQQLQPRVREYLVASGITGFLVLCTRVLENLSY